MFEIKWEEKTLTFLNKLDYLLSKRIIKKIDELKENPFSKDIKRIKRENAFRLRVGNYRIILDIDIRKQIISVLRLGHRKNIYKK